MNNERTEPGLVTTVVTSALIAALGIGTGIFFLASSGPSNNLALTLAITMGFIAVIALISTIRLGHNRVVPFSVVPFAATIIVPLLLEDSFGLLAWGFCCGVAYVVAYGVRSAVTFIQVRSRGN